MMVKRVGKTIVTVILLAAALVLGYFLIKGQREKIALQKEELQHQQEMQAVEELKEPLDAEDLTGLDEYTNLKELDLSGSDDYPAIMEYISEHPDVEVRYTVDLGGTTLDNHTEETKLIEGSFSMSLLQERLQYLPALQKLYLEVMSIPTEAVEALRGVYPEREITCMVRIGEQLYAPDAALLDLTALAPENAAAAAAALSLFPKLETVLLTDNEGGNLLSLEELQLLVDARPELRFDYRFDLFGQTVSLDEERLEYVNVPIKNEGVEELRRVLPHLKNCRSLLLDNCQIDNEVLAELRQDFPEIRIDWRVRIAHLSFLTDVKIIHLTFLLDQRDANQRAKVLQYCTDVEYLDLGHQHLTDIGFVSSMPNLKYLILSYNDLSDISPLAACKNLEMAEFYFCYALEDISPLANCEKLKLLNVSGTKVHDISPVFGLKELERFYCIMNYGIPDEQKTACFEQLPNCWITFKQVDSYDYKNVGWSFDEVGGVRAQWYLDMYKILRYRVEDYFFGDYPDEFKEQADEQAEETSDAQSAEQTDEQADS